MSDHVSDLAWRGGHDWRVQAGCGATCATCQLCFVGNGFAIPEAYGFPMVAVSAIDCPGRPLTTLDAIAWHFARRGK